MCRSTRGRRQGSGPDKLGGKRWQSRKKKSLEAVRKMAGELLALTPGAPPPKARLRPDTVWLRNSRLFIYEETPDQSRRSRRSRPYEAPMPMDRLVCGDAATARPRWRSAAAFKALRESAVALLAPTRSGASSI
jgi:transcription-repair coupling factor (superfamily II helicase)